ncbi:hypothetical protein P8S54_05105 [Thiomicrospira sp. R3]|uniref:DUF6746 family protein n=1 Tax=Thiomicrospira sp. R3 TaxID=3035472 RepID=UPI00259B58B4|nr:DUF6746 family protein [Thiomicrospira sp. R3]WFE69682.1 hypothetical protein P8S54_05105 [Thiomicrospira sp. R3]
MKKSLLTVTALSLGLLSFGSVQAQDLAVKHFKGVPSETYQQAISNLQQYNPKLSEIIAKDTLTPKDMAEIHQLTYTLENAIERIQIHLQQTAKVLEEVHQTSENAQYDKTLTQGRIYLEQSNLLIK